MIYVIYICLFQFSIPKQLPAKSYKIKNAHSSYITMNYYDLYLSVHFLRYSHCESMNLLMSTLLFIPSWSTLNHTERVLSSLTKHFNSFHFYNSFFLTLIIIIIIFIKTKQKKNNLYYKINEITNNFIQYFYLE